MPTRVTEERVRQLCVVRGFEFMRLYVDPTAMASRVIYKCHNRTHPVCDQAWDSLQHGIGCKLCGAAKNGLAQRTPDAEIIQLLDSRGCSFIKSHLKKATWVKYRCANKPSHFCDQRWETLRRGGGCKLCADDQNGIGNRIPDTQIIKLLESHGCTFIESYIKNKGTRVRYSCANEAPHDCDQPWNAIKQQGVGCKQCAIAKTSIALRTPDAEIIKWLESRGCTFMESHIKNKQTWVKYTCTDKIHPICDQRWGSLAHRNSGCRLCGIARTSKACRIPDAEIRKVLKSRGFTFIERYSIEKVQYRGRHRTESRIKYQCAREPPHDCDASWNAIKSQGAGCPECSTACSSYGERLSRHIIEHLTGCRTPRARPKWLAGLEVDGDCSAHGWAWEYDGKQHFKVIEHWGGQPAFDVSKKRRRRKIRRCRAQGVVLWRIDHRETDRVSRTGMPALVAWYAEQLQLRGIPIPHAGKRFKPDYKALYAGSDFVSVHAWREEMKRCGVTNVLEYNAAYRAGVFEVPVPSLPPVTYKLSWLELLQKIAPRGPAWAYAEGRGSLADVKNEAAESRRISSTPRCNSMRESAFSQ